MKTTVAPYNTYKNVKLYDKYKEHLALLIKLGKYPKRQDYHAKLLPPHTKVTYIHIKTYSKLFKTGNNLQLKHPLDKQTVVHLYNVIT